jgi:hypothetical protein
MVVDAYGDEVMALSREALLDSLEKVKRRRAESSLFPEERVSGRRRLWKRTALAVALGAIAWGAVEEAQRRDAQSEYLAATTPDLAIQLRQQVDGHRLRRNIALGTAIASAVAYGGLGLTQGRDADPCAGREATLTLVPALGRSSLGARFCLRF